MTAVLMEDDLYGCEETTTVAGGSLECTLYEGLFVGQSSLGHHEAYLQHKVNELLNVTAERDVLLRNISCLYNTAKEEMARKQAEINSLRADLAAARQQQHHAQQQMQRDLQLSCPTLPVGVEALRGTRQALPAIMAGSKRSRDAEMEACTHGNNDLRSNAEEAGAKRTRCHDVHDGAAADDGFKGDIGAWQQKGTSPQAQPGKKFGTTSAAVEARWHSSCLGTRNTGPSRSGTSDDRVQYPGIHHVSKHRAKENSNGRHDSHGVGLAKNIGELNASAKGSECGTSQRAGNCSRARYLESSRGNTRERLRERDSRARELHESTRFGYEDNHKDRDQQWSSRRANPSDVDARGPRNAERSAGADTGRHRDLGCLTERGSSMGDRARVLHGSERSSSRKRQEREWPLARD
ncbi:hypothetical protein Vretimale_19351 [Volvox reticuliferus]|uniref:Uncharacterized protein n=1 Tax=Volvox reticuliferus TaxID=1737510 RepID=A0A8J4GZ47_9CHLO|nr:hypothetical protein Vretimale_19351 [Volvox reticuliferus]